MSKKLSDVSKIYRHQQIYNILKSCNNDSAMTITDIYLRLVKDGIDVSNRTVIRDMDEMSVSHKLESTETQPNRYFASAGYTPDYQLNFNDEELQTVFLALESLKHMTSDYMKELCQKTEIKLLGKLPKDVLGDVNTLKAILAVNGSINGKAVSKDRETFCKVMKALREGKMIECRNNSPYNTKEHNQKKRVFSPLILNVTGGDTYLLVHDEEIKEGRKVKISRLQDVVILDKKVDQKLREKINTEHQIGGYGGWGEPVHQYEILCTQEMATYFQERKIHDSQEVKKKGIHYQMTFRANDSLEIVRLLAGFGESILHLKPAATYEKIKKIWAGGLKAS